MSNEYFALDANVAALAQAFGEDMGDVKRRILKDATTFPTRAEMVAALSSLSDSPDGRIVFANGEGYMRDRDSSAIPDMPGWKRWEPIPGVVNASDIVSYSEQSPNPAKQAQARQNLGLGSMALADEPYASRAAAEAANVPPTVDRIGVFASNGDTLWYKRDAAGSALTTGDGAKWSPDTIAMPEHWGATGDGITDDTISLRRAIYWALDSSQHLFIPPGEYRITETISHTTESENCGVIGAGVGQTRLICDFPSADPGVKIFSKKYFRFGGFSLDGRYSQGSNTTQGVDLAHLEDAYIHDIHVDDVSGQGVWCVSGRDEITNRRVRMQRLTATRCGSSGVQLQGAEFSGVVDCLAANVGLNIVHETDPGTGAGVYMKVPVEHCYHTNNIAINCPTVGFGVGSSFPGSKGRHLVFTGGIAVNCGYGIRIGEVEDSVFSNFNLRLTGSNADGLGDGVRLEGGARRNAFKNIAVSKVGASRAAARFTRDAEYNSVEISSFQEPTTGAFLAAFGSSTEGNYSKIQRGYESSGLGNMFQYGGTDNVAEIEGTANIQRRGVLTGGVLSLSNSRVSYVKVDTEGSATTDDLLTIEGGADGQEITITSTSDNRDVTVKDRSGNILLSSGDFILDRAADTLRLMYNATLLRWVEISRSDNSS